MLVGIKGRIKLGFGQSTEMLMTVVAGEQQERDET
jgi:hypothetical protein